MKLSRGRWRMATYFRTMLIVRSDNIFARGKEIGLMEHYHVTGVQSIHPFYIVKGAP